jgi:hypothetical protein
MIKKTFNIVLILVSFVLVCNGLSAKGKNTDVIIVKKSSDFKVNGEGNAIQWENTDWVSIVQRKGANNTYQTKAKVLYSETGIYFLFDCQDNKLVSTIKADNEDLWEEDVVEVFLWTNEDFPVYFEYELSPMNFELPIMVPNDKGRFFGWLPWHYDGERKTRHETSIRGGEKKSGANIDGWMAEIFIPYKLLSPLGSVPPKSGIKWRANMYRIDYDDGMSTFSWQETEKTFHDYKKFGTFEFE